jgi:subtilisin family serine protease
MNETPDAYEGESDQMPSGSMDEDHAGMVAGNADEMPTGMMNEDAGTDNDMPAGMMPGDMTGGEGVGGSPSEHAREVVLVELRISDQLAGDNLATSIQALSIPGLAADPDFAPVPMKGDPADAETVGLEAREMTVIVKAVIDPARRSELESRPEVVGIWKDTPIAPFNTVQTDAPPDADPTVADFRSAEAVEANLSLELIPSASPCPFGTCDCSSSTPKGTIADVARYLGADKIWAAGYRGTGIQVAVFDGGITAQGRTPKPGENATKKIPNVIGGWPSDWGTTAAAWGNHGNMCATDVLGMAPDARVLDIRISGSGGSTATISRALAGLQWVIDRFRRTGKPEVCTNSWGIFQESWDPSYARNANHPFTRKVEEAIDEGIIVLFAAGNCGGTCPDGRCGSNSGPGQSIWGANGHPKVITVGGVNRLEQLAGYSSQGPAALDRNKPDFCAITHFTGYFRSDSGTSAATPICAGVVALLKQTKPSLSSADVKLVLKGTAKNLGPAGFDPHSGSGVIRAKAAFDRVNVPSTWKGWENLGGFCTDGVGVSSWAPNRLDCFVIGNNRALYHKWWTGSAWRGWEHLGGRLYSNPAAVSWGGNRIDVFAIGGDHAMWHRWWDGRAWRGWESLGGFCTNGVGVSSWAPNRLDCFVVGNNRALYHKWWDGRVWRGWENLGGQLYSNPSAVSWGPNRIDVFAIGGDHAMWHRWWDGSAWQGWERLGGFCTDGVGVSSWGPNRLDCFVVGVNRALYHKWWDGRAWRGWESLGGRIYSNPAAVSWANRRIDVFALGGNRAMYHRWYS